MLNTAQNFYILPSRLFEFAAGGLIAVSPDNYRAFKKSNMALSVGAVLIMLLLLVDGNVDIDKVRLIITVLVTCVFVIIAERKENYALTSKLKWLGFLGIASYSLYLWHQVIMAFYRYTVDCEMANFAYVIVISLSFLVGIASFYLLEQPLTELTKKNKTNVYVVNGLCALCALFLVCMGEYYYKRKGVVRDVPELDLYLKDSPITESQEYNSCRSALDEDFVENGKKNILVIGDSFGRDWINVLIESGVDSVMNISYHTDMDYVVRQRIEKADYIFVSRNGAFFDKYARLLPLMEHKSYYIVGCKSYGPSPGNIYNNDRYGQHYYEQAYKDISLNTLNRDELSLFGKHYIDMMGALANKQGLIPSFTPDKKLISHDGIHLTKAGAQYYAALIDVWGYLK